MPVPRRGRRRLGRLPTVAEHRASSVAHMDGDSVPHKGHKRRRRRTGGTHAAWRELVHQLNERYRQEFERAEALAARLRDLEQSRLIRLAQRLRVCKAKLLQLVSVFNVARKRSAPALRGEGQTAATPLAWGRHQGSDSPQDMSLAPPVRADRVSVIVPFRDQVQVLRQCLSSLRSLCQPPGQVILLDNGSRRASTLRWLERIGRHGRVTVVDCPGAFHFSRLCNLGARHATGEALLFLNSDTEALTPESLEQMLAALNRPDVGIVGALLLYPDGTVQHAGIYPPPSAAWCADPAGLHFDPIALSGLPARGAWFHRYRGERLAGIHKRLPQLQSVPAVTGACLLVRTSLFISLGGFDEGLPVTHNDVDLCLRAWAAGYRVVLASRALFLHYECLTRGFAAIQGAG
ncbi:MAG: hypothetical protein C4297_08260 [Gemmataceae bacterium]